jgi:hypothetical protein
MTAPIECASGAIFWKAASETIAMSPAAGSAVRAPAQEPASSRRSRLETDETSVRRRWSLPD